MHTETSLLQIIRSQSGRDFSRVQFKANRVRLLSVSRDGATLYLHASFRAAPQGVVDAIAAFLRAGQGSAASTRAAAQLRRWASAQAATDLVGTGAAGSDSGSAGPVPATTLRRPPRPGRCCGTPAQRRFLTELYRDFNRTNCGNRLPADLPLRFSDRMRRRLGHFRYYSSPAGTRVVVEIAINIDLMAAGSEQQLRDTLLHEMAHVEAWLEYGDRGHGPDWRRIARRFGCVPRACTAAPVALRQPGSLPTTRVPPRYLV